MNLNLPNSLTLFRIFVIPIMVYLFLSGGESNRMFTSILFLLAIITDYLDGMVARTMNQQTKFGEFLDPIADKLLVIIILLLLITENNGSKLSRESVISRPDTTFHGVTGSHHTVHRIFSNVQ